MRPDEIRSSVHRMMPDILKNLSELIRYPSISFPGYPREPVEAMAAATADLLRQYGLGGVRQIEVPGSYPAIYGETPAPCGGPPTVLCYAHYDVQPAPEEGWETDPWTPVIRNGRLFGRGAADNKSGILTIAGAIRVFAGNTPVRVKVFIEGGEEGGGDLLPFIIEHPELFGCDLFLINDMGTLTPGEPAITTTCRGEVACVVTVMTLHQAVHSGTFGGAAPDALMALIRILADLVDSDGRTSVRGLASFPGNGEDCSEEVYRKTAGVLEGVDLVGSGPISSRLWGQPSVNVIGIDGPPMAGTTNALVPKASAIVSLRIAPGSNPEQELRLLMAHIRQITPWHVHLELQKLRASSGFVCPRGGPLYSAAHKSLKAAYGRPVREIGSGGTIPLLNTLQQIAPQAEFVLWGCEDQALSRIHGKNESVDMGEVERLILAQSLLWRSLGADRERTSENGL